MAGAASAAEEGLFIGADAGQSTMKAESDNNLGPTLKLDESDTAYKGYAGINFTNWFGIAGLSKRRADAVANLKSRGMQFGDRFVTQGFGEEKPIADNSTEEGRVQNRRVSIHRTDCPAQGSSQH